MFRTGTRRSGDWAVDRARLAADQKKATRLHATLVFIDETGLFMMPLVRRTWGLRGKTPILHTRTRCHEHLSVIGALTISPVLRRLGWYLKFHPKRSIRQQEALKFLSQLLRHVRGPIVLLWDRLNVHRGRQVKKFVERHSRLHMEFFPAYAPELNPNEYGWAHLKGYSLANYCPNDLDELHHTVLDVAPATQTNQSLLRGFVQATKLPLRLPKSA